jgi:riboflavin synthase
LTVELKDNLYSVTAIGETVQKTNLGNWVVGDNLNLERAMKLETASTDMVQGHVDQTGTCIEAQETNGSWYTLNTMKL